MEKGSKTFEFASLIQEEIEMLYNSGAFDCNISQALVQQLFKKDTDGKEYLEYSTGRLNKTRTSTNLVRRLVKPRMYESLSAGPGKNPIDFSNCTKLNVLSHLFGKNASFYLGVNHANASKADLTGVKWLNLNQLV